MKPLYYIILFVLTVCSCGSQKSNLKQETLIETCNTQLKQDSIIYSRLVKESRIENVTEMIEEVITAYDTRQPVDETTGRHPVISETKKTIRRNSSWEKQIDDTICLMQSTSESNQKKAEVIAYLEEEMQKTETTLPKQVSGIIWALGALLSAIVVGWLTYNTRKK